MVRITWCPGCGNFAILKAFERASRRVIEEGFDIAVSSGIGCHGKISDYLSLPGFHVIHGRVPPFLTGLKLANPNLVVVGFSGDGDGLNEGVEHLVHAARRNTDITIILHNNGVFGLTTGQVTATSPRGRKSRSTPRGNPEYPLNPCHLMLVSGATFVARVFAGEQERLSEVFYNAMKHKGFSFVEVMQPCVSFNNFWEMRKEIYWIERSSDLLEAMKNCSDAKACGIFYAEEKETYEDAVWKSTF
ncbi:MULTISPECIES: thiamine pyrophosphate-dependent enzyme [Archaeoglobus]|jgi:2-oxoglutarate ferredoxin oxidoreductase subunit beta|uniref:2-oxoacid ferredoxin oxidoreductase, subunit beta (OrB) n=3 Tax=Archaeoglobus fulgidus TaxID=2234 RepID=O29508_ARCFU|nr:MULTISPECIES: thiamine pyrophosphate-dependent enzyme [Archaeoglobus]AAB90490.1 2-oxoacid ferredoxin oxidoreductase, subunit beta (orB) [Archaeoglobus fulgidus DSM 4304]AIG97626.1 Pyruvate:ferredoxin oxidoreductase [Archaeoglobus fulgidus DSM 8774]KUJ93521.1 MAG: 2-oxoacid ferredoxin oxidoreductase, subunit beta (OrB) [Archaeoglobus fulgidus]KUK07120.1 MAG: 2-oxoacid ferredoxin oxidoreductase, subunit beta (OrB) [Archaeoglobus fulgidus]MDI3496851.1 2-oxoglutarate/2-oxoacid ferredoxin oxidor